MILRVPRTNTEVELSQEILSTLDPLEPIELHCVANDLVLLDRESDGRLHTLHMDVTL